MKVTSILLALLLAFAPVSMGALYEDNSTNLDQQQQQGQIGINDQDQKQKQQQAQGQAQGQLQVALAAQGQMQGNLNKNEGNQGQAEVNVSQEFEDQLQFPTHVAFAAPSGTETAQMSIGGLTLSDTAPHVVAQAKMNVIIQALDWKLMEAEDAKVAVADILDDLEIQTRPKRIFGVGPKTSGKHLFNLFGIIATDSWRGNGPDESEEPVTIDEL